MQAVITGLDPALEDITVGVDQEWWITAELRDDEGEPVRDPSTGEIVTVVTNWWTSGAWNYYPPQAYNPATGHRFAQWEDPVGSGNMSSAARMATYDEVEPFLQAQADQAMHIWQEQHPNL